MMTLSVRQKSNIRHFVYYLVNGTLDFELMQKTFGDHYHDKLISDPDLFYKTACVYINQEIKLNPKWPDVKKLGKFICQLYYGGINTDFEVWEMDYAIGGRDFSADFKSFVKWFIEAKTVKDVSFRNYINDGASYVEQCFAIWSNVVVLDENKVTNYAHAIERVEQYIKSYYVEGYEDDLGEWECELHME
jgi:hypothetical protein